MSIGFDWRGLAGWTLLAAWGMMLFEGVFAAAPRNPFWPIGHVGEATEISADAPGRKAVEAARLAESNALHRAQAAAEAAAKARAAAAAAERRAREAAAVAAAAQPATIEEQDWVLARKAMKIGNPVRSLDQDGHERIAININGGIYSDGDYVSVTHGRGRFTWRIQGLGTGTSLRLVRIRALIVEKSKDGTNEVENKKGKHQ